MKSLVTALCHILGGGDLLGIPVCCAWALLLTTENCFDALKQLRERDTPKVLWIDSLCIDQKSAEERSQQVTMIGEIYKNAEHDCILIGEKVPNQDLNSHAL